MDKEIKNVVDGKYSNVALDNYMSDALYLSLITLDMSHYMNLLKLRESVITDAYTDTYEHNEETTLGL